MSASYSIKDLEMLSGIKAHTIRAWEMRYGILQAERTSTNIRVYNDRELRLLLSISLLNRRGIKISKLSKLSEQELQEKVVELAEMPAEYEAQIEGLLIATISYDEVKFEHILNNCILQLGFEETVIRIIFPFLEKVGIMWVAGSLIAAQEHFMSQLIRQKLIVAIDGQTRRNATQNKKWLLFLPNNEWHELSLLFLNYLLRSKDQNVMYLGASVQLEDVLTVADTIKPHYFYTIITSVPTGFTVREYLNRIASEFPDSRVFASGIQMLNKSSGFRKNVTALPEMKHVLKQIREFAA